MFGGNQDSPNKKEKETDSAEIRHVYKKQALQKTTHNTKHIYTVRKTDLPNDPQDTQKCTYCNESLPNLAGVLKHIDIDKKTEAQCKKLPDLNTMQKWKDVKRYAEERRGIKKEYTQSKKTQNKKLKPNQTPKTLAHELRYMHVTTSGEI